MSQKEINVIGAGLAGCEAAWQISRMGLDVVLFEMKPLNFSPAHTDKNLAELVCSNSFKATSLENATGLLKEELRVMNSLIMAGADKNSVSAGGALAVDRKKFSEWISEAIENDKRIRLVRKEIVEIPDGVTIIATGPLTSPAFTNTMNELIMGKHLYFFDAIAPIVEAGSIDQGKSFKASRYGKGGDDYINCPMNRDEYYAFVDALLKAESVPFKPWERESYFEGCIPIEEMAKRGKDTLAFGPMKPVGLINPSTGKRPFAVVQLRPEDRWGSLYNMVGFQTKLKWPEQDRVFRTIPALERAVFSRCGSVHRNTYICSPALLKPNLEMRKRTGIFFAGQLVGVEGYMESTAMGLIAGINAGLMILGKSPLIPPATTAIGSLIHHIVTVDPKNFQPMNINFGLIKPLDVIVPKKDRRITLSRRALDDIKSWKQRVIGALGGGDGLDG